MRAAVTVTVRKRSSGYRLFACAVDSLEHAHTLANLIARSVEYARCFVTATDQFGNELFSVGLNSPVVAPQQSYAPTYAPALPHYAPARAVPETDSYVVDAEIIPIAPRLPPRRY